MALDALSSTPWPPNCRKSEKGAAQTSIGLLCSSDRERHAFCKPTHTSTGYEMCRGRLCLDCDVAGRLQYNCQALCVASPGSRPNRSGINPQGFQTHAAVAQLVEHWPEEPGVIGSIPIRSTTPWQQGPIAQSGRAAGSYPVGLGFKSLWALHDLSRSTFSENRIVRTWTNGPIAQPGRCRGLLILSTLVQIQLGSPFGDLAQLGERLSGRQKVAGSTPAVSTIWAIGVIWEHDCVASSRSGFESHCVHHQLMREACWLRSGAHDPQVHRFNSGSRYHDPVAKRKGVGLQVRSSWVRVPSGSPLRGSQVR